MSPSCLIRLACAVLASLSVAAWPPTTARANDGIFPPASAAKASIDFDGRGFLVNGKRTFLASAGLEYARVPRALWRDRLQRIKRAGFNTVEIYVFWNFHEPQEGKWNFSDDHDLGAFLREVKAMGLYAIVRVGPYVCAEWNSGGYPVWLRFKTEPRLHTSNPTGSRIVAHVNDVENSLQTGLRVREPNALFEAAVDRYFEKVIPLVAANQVNHGGAVVLVQLENEHPKGWGTEMPNSYFTHLRDKAVSLGLEVPYFFSGLHHGNDPAGGKPWDSTDRKNPWFTTEFWCDWYDKYGNPSPQDTRKEDRATWKILAYGGNGYNYYMFHGGTNFAHWNSNEDASSYDYGAAIGQGGDLRPIYYRFKRAASFATSFAPILENSTNATDLYQKTVTNAAVAVTARHSPSGDALFLDNNTNSPVETQVMFAEGETLPSAGPLRLEAGEIMPLVRDFPLGHGVVLARAVARVLGVTEQGDGITTLVVYGQVGTPFELHFALPNGKAVFKGQFANQVNEDNLTAGNHRVRILAVSDTLADHTFFVEAGGRNYVVCGPAYVGDVESRGETLRLIEELPWSNDGWANFPGTVYGPGPKPLPMRGSPVSSEGKPSAPALSAWEVRRADDEAQPGYRDKRWRHSENPLPLGADGDDGASVWYRTTLPAPAAGTYTLSLGGARDRSLIFVDGAPVSAPSAGGYVPLTLTAGDHLLAVLSVTEGRDKLFGHLGAIDNVDVKGLNGPVFLRQSDPNNAQTVADWRYQLTERPRTPVVLPAANPGWLPVTTNVDVFNKQPGWAWYQATLPALSSDKAVLHFAGVDDNATVYLNGVEIGQHAGWQEAFDVPLNRSSLSEKPAVLTVLVENRDNTGGISGPVTLTRYTYEAPVTGWTMRGGMADPKSKGGWSSYSPNTALPANHPRLYRAAFSGASLTERTTGPHPIVRATFAGLSHGFLFLNGHNLGRYPEKVPIDGIYLPECWIEAGKNTLTVLEEEGNAPTGVRLEIEEAASRIVREREASVTSPAIAERAR